MPKEIVICLDESGQFEETEEGVRFIGGFIHLYVLLSGINGFGSC